MTQAPGRLFVFGLGYTGLRFAAGLRTKGWRVGGTVRGAAKATELAAQGVAALPFDGTAPSADVMRALAEATHVLSSVPPDAAGDPVLRHHAGDLAVAPRLGWIGYLSTIGVYGDRNGGWVDETAAPEPASPRAEARVAAEAAWLALATRRGIPGQVFRLGGIYGPGRNALRALAEGTARRIVKDGQVFNRIHVDDVVRALEAAVERPRSGAIYNVVDDAPSAPEAPVVEAARLLGIPPPPPVRFEAADLSPMARSFYAGNRRVSNAKLKRELGLALLHPTVHDGLQALHEAGEGCEPGGGRRA